MLLSSNNNNIASRSALSSPGEVQKLLPLAPAGVEQVLRDREAVCRILDGRDKRLMMIVGPCSIHNPDSAVEYARRLKELADKLRDRIFVIMRVYFEKPRTTVGWKGLIYDPDINGQYNIEKGILLSRGLILKIVELGLPAATEMLDPILAQYLADAVSWAAIGARTTEAQTHRQMGSGLSMPVGFKNATDGSCQTALDAIVSAASRHSFIGIMEDGRVGVFRTKGNAYAHLVLRGGSSGGNYSAEHVAFVKVALKRAGLRQSIVVDCSHANSGKRFECQGAVLRDILQQIADGENSIVGAMLESNLKCGAQKVVSGKAPAPDVSITDGCIGWEETCELLHEAYDRMKVRF